MADYPHKPRFVENELRRIASEGVRSDTSDWYFKMIVAEALLMLLDRTAPKKRSSSTTTKGKS